MTVRIITPETLLAERNRSNDRTLDAWHEVRRLRIAALAEREQPGTTRFVQLPAAPCGKKLVAIAQDGEIIAIQG